VWSQQNSPNGSNDYWVTSVGFSPNGNTVFAAGYRSRTEGWISRWNVTDGVEREMLTPDYPIQAVYSMAVSSDGHMVAAGTLNDTVGVVYLP
jgi:WD40 repeat protein